MNAYTFDMALWSHTAEISNSRFYLLRFPLPEGPAAIARSVQTTQIDWPGMLGTSYSADRVVLAKNPTYWDAERDWAVRIVLWAGSERLQVLRSWRWREREVSLPPYGVSNDGRYLVFLENDGKVFDTKSLQFVETPGISRMFAMARELEPRGNHYFHLTQNLNYLVFEPVRRSLSKSLDFKAGDKEFSRKWHHAFIDRRNMTVGAFPSKLNYDHPEESPIFYQEAAESEEGQLQLLYYQSAPSTGGGILTIRDKDLKILHQVVMPALKTRKGETVAGFSSWDPANHRILSYPAAHLGEFPQPRKFVIRDYKENTQRVVTVDVAGAFRQFGGGFVPKEIEMTARH